MVGELMAEGHPDVAIDPVKWHQAYGGYTILPVFELSLQYTDPL